MGVVSRSGSYRSIALAASLASLWSIASAIQAVADNKATHERPAEELAAAKEIDGRELFERQWKAGDERSHGGDGLGPMFNEKSCVACHKDGGVGGGGPRENNALILTPVALGAFAGSLDASEKSPFTDEELTNLHPGLTKSPSVVLHRFSTTDGYAAWFKQRRGRTGNADAKVDRRPFPGLVAKEVETLRGKSKHMPVGNIVEGVTAIVSERNTTSLFGVGAIEEVSDDDILAAETLRFSNWPDVTGRAIRFKDGRVGRFGWKAQKPSLREFVATACAVELGLQVPDFHQSMDPRNPSDTENHELDLDDAEVTALTMFIASLDKPTVNATLTTAEKKVANNGRQVFNAVGCAACHLPEIGQLKGAFTDLLVHDMGQQVADVGQYSATPVAQVAARPQKGSASVADQNEWRTPPLWGLHDSAPYMHDGRADTVEEAIAWHGGEAHRSVVAYFSLPAPKRLALLAFVNSLVAPKSATAKPEGAAGDDPYSKPAPSSKTKKTKE